VRVPGTHLKGSVPSRSPLCYATAVSKLAPVEDALHAIAAGRMVILVDDEDRENEGDLVVAADAVTAEHIAFMSREARGLICVALTADRCAELQLSPMVSRNTAPLGTAFTRSVDHRRFGGLGATARAATIRAAVDPGSRAEDFVSPGHIFPLRARPGGVLVRSGQTEGSVDLARLAGRAPAGVICEVMAADGTMMRLPRLLELGAEHGIPVTTVADLIRYRLENERLVRCLSEAQLPTEYGVFQVRCFEDLVHGQIHVALIHGDITGDSTLVRVHRADPVADVFGLDFMPSRSRLAWSLRRMVEEGGGVLVYLRPDGDDDPFDDRLRLYGALARGERPAVGAAPSMGFHDFGIGAQILGELGLSRIRVITNRPRSFKGLAGYGISIVGWVPLGEPHPAAP